MEKPQSLNGITFQDIENILKQWQFGTITRKKVYEYADSLYYLEFPGWPAHPKDNPRSVLFMVVESLELMYNNPTIVEDVPALLKALSLAHTNPQQAWEYMDKYWGSINWEERLQKWR